MTRLADVVRTSAQVGATASRLAKIAALAERLRSLDPDEVDIALPYLSGDIRQSTFRTTDGGLTTLTATGNVTDSTFDVENGDVGAVRVLET